MAEFVIVAAALAGLASAAPAPAAATTAATTVPLNAPTVGFRTYSDLASCEQAAAVLVVPAGRRLVCLPVEPLLSEVARPY